MGVLFPLRSRFSFSLSACAVSLLMAMSMVSPLPLLAESMTDDDSPFCQVIESQDSPYLDVTALREAIEQGGDLNQLCDFYDQRSLPLNLLISSESDLIELALAQGADVNAEDSAGNMPLHYVRYHGQDIAQSLIDRGADVNARNRQGSTPLHNIFGDKSPTMMQLLLDHGADINARDQEQFTPLHQAREETVDWLLANGADINARTNQNWTPLHYAVTVPAVAIPLIEAGADLTIENAQGAPIHGGSLEPAVLSAMLDQGVDVNLTNSQGETPLHRHRFSPELTRILIERGANLNAQDNQGRTPLFEVNIEVARQLVAAGADLTLRDEQGRTALHQAAIEETSFWGIELTALFLSQDLPDLLSVRDNNGETALDIARRLEKTEIVNLLQAAEPGRGQVSAPTDETIAELQQLLQAQSWAAADRETRRLLAPNSVSNRPAPEAVTITPELIRAIDQAWLVASNGRFGLSVQLRLWQEAQAAHPNDRDAAVDALRDRLGWKIPAPREENDFISSDWRNESELTYSLEAPEGHLPWAGVSDAVVQAVAVPPPGVHCGVCTADAMALRHSRFYGRIPELMDKVAMARVVASRGSLTCQATTPLENGRSLTYQISGTLPLETTESAETLSSASLRLTVQRRDPASGNQTWLNESALSDYTQIAPDADYSRLPFSDLFRAQANNGDGLHAATASVNGLYISLRPMNSQPQQMQVVHYLSPGQYVRSSGGTCQATPTGEVAE